MQELRWVVHKFGGSSLADADCLRRVASIVEALPEPRVALVLSACRGVTDELIRLVGLAELGDEAGCEAVLSRLLREHEDIATSLLAPPARDAFVRQLQTDIADLRRITHAIALVRSAGRDVHDLAAGFVELWSSRLFAAFLENRARRGQVRWIDSREIVIVERGALGPGVSGLHAHDKDVIVIGGGDTGTDWVATALRQGCRSLVQFEILPKPPDDRAADNPWPEWPKLYRLDYGQEEAAAKYGADPRAYLTTAQEIVGDPDGRLQSLVTVQVAWQENAAGQFAPEPVPGSERMQPAQLVLLALGFTGPEQALLDDIGVLRDGRTNVRAKPDGYATSVDGVFAAGDCRRGQSLVVWAIREGREAARECDRYLMGRRCIRT